MAAGSHANVDAAHFAEVHHSPGDTQFCRLCPVRDFNENGGVLPDERKLTLVPRPFLLNGFSESIKKVNDLVRDAQPGHHRFPVRLEVLAVPGPVDSNLRNGSG